MTRLIGRAAALATIALGIAACDSDSANQNITPPPLPEGATVRVVHASADAPDVDVVVNGASFAEGLAFKAATSLQAVAAGSVTVQVDGIVHGGVATVIGPVDVTLANQTENNIIAVGSVSAIEPLVVTSPLPSFASGTVRVQVVHGSPSAPQVDVYVTAPGADLVQSAPLGSFAFKENLGPVEIPQGDYQIRVTLPGDPGTVVFDSGTVSLPTSNLLVVAVDNTRTGSSPISLLVTGNSVGTFEILDKDTPAQFRVIHNSPDAPAVDVVVNDDFVNPPLLESVPFPMFSDFIEVPADTYNVKVTAENNPGAIVIDENLTLEAGQQYSVYAVDVLANIGAYVLVDDLRSVATEAKTRIVHLAPSAGLVDIYVTPVGADISTLSPAFPGVDFRDETGYVSLAAGSYDVTVAVAGTKTAAIGPATITLEAGEVYTAVARDAVGSGAPFGLILLDAFN
ncbi:MAG TPA: DUF4397 domain-containing protein [Gammaproteobacteria bacterium]